MFHSMLTVYKHLTLGHSTTGNLYILLRKRKFKVQKRLIKEGSKSQMWSL